MCKNNEKRNTSKSNEKRACRFINSRLRLLYKMWIKIIKNYAKSYYKTTWKSEKGKNMLSLRWQQELEAFRRDKTWNVFVIMRKAFNINGEVEEHRIKRWMFAVQKKNFQQWFVTFHDFPKLAHFPTNKINVFRKFFFHLKSLLKVSWAFQVIFSTFFMRT